MILLALMVALAPPFTCAGPFIPPTDFDVHGNAVTMEFAVAVGNLTSPREVMETRAQELLVQKLCRLADHTSCAPLAAKVKLWQSAKGDKLCVMSVVSSLDLEAWRSQLAPDLGDELKQALRPLLPALEGLPQKKSLLTGKVKQRIVLVVLGGVRDNGAPGGLRAEWLLGRVREVFTAMGVEMREPPKGWNGLRPPKDVELLVRGELVERVDLRKQLPVFDVMFSAVDARGAIRNGKTITLPAALAPAPPRPVNVPPATIGLQVYAETRPSGSLCSGDWTQVHIANDSSEELYVRVLNIDDNGEVLMLFPSETRADDRVSPGKSVPLSEDGFVVDGPPEARETYVALTARGPEGLGKFRDIRGTCRFRPADARKIGDGKKLEAAYRATGGFTLLDDVRCQRLKIRALPDPALAAQALDQLPWCPALD